MSVLDAVGAEVSETFSNLAITTGESICDTCHKINFKNLMKVLSKECLQRGASYKLRYSPNCAICELLFHPSGTQQQEQELELCSLSFCHESVWATSKIPEACDSILLRQALPGPRWKYEDCPAGWVFCVPYDDTSKGLFKPQVVQETWDHGKVRLWLQSCLRSHDLPCKQTTTTVIKNMNLIDCNELAIVRADFPVRWVTLSYVWGLPPQSSAVKNDVGFREGSRLPSDLCRTIEDAIGVTKQLGYRFLWVDEYCIDQLDENHRTEQIGQMDKIYMGTDLTIVAAAGEDKSYGLPGVNTTKRKTAGKVRVGDFVLFSTGPEPISDIKSSKWFTRAWTFQEGALSERLLVFTDYQMSFYCRSNSWAEGLGGLELLQDKQVDWDLVPTCSPFIPSELLALESSSSSIWKTFTALITQYSVRNLTFPDDALNAFLGVTQSVLRGNSEALTLCGLPLFVSTDTPAADTWSRMLFAALSWHPTNRSETKRRAMFPSWTWVGWQGGVDFLYSESESSPYKCTIQNMALETSLKEVVPLPALSEWADSENADATQRALDTVTAIRFEAPIIPASHIMEEDSDFTLVRPSKKDTDPRWRKFSVAGAAFGIETRPTAAFLDKLVDNVGSGEWSCLYLGHDEDEFSGFRLVLVVQWMEDGESAERVGAYGLQGSKTVEEDLGSLDELTWRRVRLI